MSLTKTKTEYNNQEGSTANRPYLYKTIGARAILDGRGKTINILPLSSDHPIFCEGMDVRDALKTLELIKEMIDLAVSDHKKLES